MQLALRVVGLSHMIVTSGYHLSIIMELAKKILGKVSRAATILGAYILMIILVSITGLSASILRAVLMSLLSLSFWYYGRKFHPGRLLLYVAAISLIVSPSYITNVAWLLSFSAFFGIIFFSPVLTKFLYGDEEPNYVMSSIITTLSAQIFCLPISIYNFGMVSLVGVLAGLLITPTIPYVMLLVSVSPFLPATKYLAKILLGLHLFIIDAFSKIPWAAAEIAPGNAFIFLIYLPICVLFLLIKRATKFSFRPRYALDKIPEYGKIYPC